MAFEYRRIIRFHETDAAGVLYFANVLTLCHEAYEASLAAADVDLTVYFSGQDVAVPVVHASVDFRRPMRCGDAIAITLTPEQTQASTFEICYRLHAADRLLATALTRHVCIEAATRQRTTFTPDLNRWLTRWSATAPADG